MVSRLARMGGRLHVLLTVLVLAIIMLAVVARGAFNGAVTNWISDWSEDGTNVTVAIASFPELTAAEADATTGDIRDVTYALVDKLYDEYVDKAASTNQPSRMVVTRTSAVNPTDTTVVYTYTFKFTVQLAPGELVDE